jgi:hypothetical protein
MFADLIDNAPLLTARDSNDFQWMLTATLSGFTGFYPNPLRCFSMVTADTQCVKLAVDFGEDWHFAKMCHVLVEGEFRMNVAAEFTLNTAGVYPMPLKPSFPVQFRRKTVFAVFAASVQHVYLYGTHRIGEWVITQSSTWPMFEPKDYVFDKHLNVRVYNSDPGCNCCVDLELSASKTSKHRIQERQQLEFFVRNVSSEDHLGLTLNAYGVDVVSRLVEVLTQEFHKLPYHSDSLSQYRACKLSALKRHVFWRRRRDLLFCSSKEPVGPKGTSIDVLLGDSRLYGRTALNRVRSLYIGAVLSFL